MATTVRLDQKSPKTTRVLTDKLTLIDVENTTLGIAPLKQMELSDLGLLPVGGTTGQVLSKASETDLDAEWIDVTGGGSGVSVTTNIVRVEPNAEEEVEGQLYFTYADALAYVLTQTVDADNTWIIELPSGDFSEDIELHQFISIVGNFTILTGTLTSEFLVVPGPTTMNDVLTNTTYINKCKITKMDLSNSTMGGVAIIYMYDCFFELDSFIDSVVPSFIINKNCNFNGGDFNKNIIMFNFNSIMVSGEYPIYNSTFNTVGLQAFNSSIFGGIFNGGEFTNSTFTKNGNDIIINAGVYDFSDSILKDFDFEIGSVLNELHNCTLKEINFSYTTDTGNILNLFNCVEKDCSIKMPLTPGYDGVLNIYNCSGAFTETNVVNKTIISDLSIQQGTPSPTTAGVLMFDDDFLYVNTPTGGWKKVGLTSI